MRILQHHAEFIEYQPIEKEIELAEPTEKKLTRFENIVVLFTCVEKNDNKEMVKRVVKDLKQYLEKLKINEVLIYPFAHLSRDLANPSDALEIIKELERQTKNLGIQTYRAPFGWTKQYSLKIKGHPLAETAKIYTPEAEGEKIDVKEITKRLGKRPVLEKEKLSEHDHRIIGQQLDLYSFHEVGPGMVFFHHKGMILRNILEEFSRKVQLERGYQEVSTPLLLDKTLWEISGHAEHYKDLMFFTELEGREFAIKPMNCPGAILIFKTKTRSYKDLPMRLAEFGLVHRNELSGVLSGLLRVRALTQDDAHIFVTPEQLEEELLNVINLVDYFYKTFSFPYTVELSTRPENYMGELEIWNRAESALKEALKKREIEFKINPGEGAFYGPKIDFHIKDSLDRKWQLATVQIDFQMPERFDINYIDERGKPHRPVIIHRAIYGSLERFIGILVEHYQGKFPLWLSPIQVRILSISDENVEYAEEIVKRLKENNIRVELDSENATLEYKIRNAQLQKIPYMLIVGKKEEENRTVTIRTRDGIVNYNIKLEDFIKQLNEEIKQFK
ncbi:MAG: threonine--tRNA ligase [Candidatus Aenigmatarchaeota archaeon]